MRPVSARDNVISFSQAPGWPLGGTLRIPSGLADWTVESGRWSKCLMKCKWKQSQQKAATAPLRPVDFLILSSRYDLCHHTQLAAHANKSTQFSSVGAWSAWQSLREENKSGQRRGTTTSALSAWYHYDYEFMLRLTKSCYVGQQELCMPYNNQEYEELCAIFRYKHVQFHDNKSVQSKSSQSSDKMSDSKQTP